MKKSLCYCIFYYMFFFTTFTYSDNLKNDIDISNMPLCEVVSILSKESGENIIASQEAKNIFIDAYFEKGEDVKSVLISLCDAYNLSLNKSSYSTVLSLKKENKENKSKLILKVLNSINQEPIEGVRVVLKDIGILERYTNNDGLIIIDNIPKSVYIINFYKKNFYSEGEIINIDKSLLSMDIELCPLTEKKEKNDIMADKATFYESNGEIIYTQTLSLLNISSNEAKKVLLENFNEKIKISSLPKINKIIVSAEKDILENIKKILKSIDKNPRQVKVTTEILDISDNLFEELGFDWVHSHSKNKDDRENYVNSNILGVATNVATGTIFGNQFSVFRQFRGKTDVLNVGINLLQANNDLVISSIPTITIANGEEGEFKVTEEVIAGEKIEKKLKQGNNNKGNKNYISEPIFKEAGLILKVQPFIKDNDEIILNISIELSDFKFKKNLLNIGEINSGTYNSNGGSKVGRSLSTKVKVKNGDTILLGGLKKSIKQNFESKVPILGDIPILDLFFKKISKKSDNSDMYIKLKVDIEE